MFIIPFSDIETREPHSPQYISYLLNQLIGLLNVTNVLTASTPPSTTFLPSPAFHCLSHWPRWEEKETSKRLPHAAFQFVRKSRLSLSPHLPPKSSIGATLLAPHKGGRGERGSFPLTLLRQMDAGDPSRSPGMPLY